LWHVDGLTGGGTLVRLRSEAIERYRVDYVAGFAADGFSYFVTNQHDAFTLSTSSGLLPTVSGARTSHILQVSPVLGADQLPPFPPLTSPLFRSRSPKDS